MTTPQQKLFSLQRDLYEQAYQKAQTSIWGSSRALKDYFSRFEKDLPDQFTTISQETLIKSIRKKDIVLVGDFHTLQQSQRGYVRLIRAYIHKYKTDKIVLALEAFRACDQEHINLFLTGVIEEEEFLRRTHYYANWSFSWNNFKVIFDLAKTFGLKIIGINSDRAGKDSLFTRDRFAANALINILGKNHSCKIFCLIGEFHLSQQHLPSFLARRFPRCENQPKIARIISNVDKYYLQLNLFLSRSSTEYLQLDTDYYCILNCPPWLKWQSYNIWEESQLADDLLLEDLSYSELERIFEDTQQNDPVKYDIESHFHNILNILCRFFNFSIPSSELFNFNIFAGHRSEIEEYIKIFGPKDKKTAKQIQYQLDSRSNIFLPEKNTALLTSVNLNSLADIAGRFLYFKFHDASQIYESLYHNFYAQLILSACGFVASKILNPNRKCLSYQEQKKFYQDNKLIKLNGRSLIKKETAKLFIKHEDWIERKLNDRNPGFKRPISQIYRDDIKLGHYLSHSLGKTLGNKFYQQFIHTHKLKIGPDFLFHIPTDDFQVLWEKYIFLSKTLKQ